MAARRPKAVDEPVGAQASLTLRPDIVARRKEMFGRAPGRAHFAMTSPARPPTISSSALRKIGEDSASVRRRRRNRAQTDRTWQVKVFDYAEQVGELGALLTLQSNVVSLCGFPVRRWDEETSQWLANDPEPSEAKDHEPLPQLEPAKPKPNPITGEMMPPPDHPKLLVPQAKPAESKYDDRPANVMRAFVGPDGEQRELIRTASWNLFAAGETTLLGTASKAGILWEFLSIEELYPNASGNYVRQRGGAGSPIETLPPDNYTGRLWRKSGRFSDLADSQVKRVLPILQEIVTLTMMIDAIAQSRLSANMLFIPEEMSFSSRPTDTEPGDDDESDDLDDELFEHMTAPVGDQSSAARIVPLVIRGKAEHGDAIRIIELSRTFDEFAQGLRTEALDRLGKGLEAPPESIAGKGCLDDQSQILTTTGWKGIDELAVGDRVLALDHTTGRTRWEPVEAMHRYDVVDEPMHATRGVLHDSLTTAEHRWPVERVLCGECDRLAVAKGRCLRCWKRARRAEGAPPAAIAERIERVWVTSAEMADGDRLVLAAPHDDLPAEQKWSDALVEVAAWAATDGDTVRQQIRIRQTPSANPGNCERIAAALDAAYPGEWASGFDAATGCIEYRLSAEASRDLLHHGHLADGRFVIDAGFVQALTLAQLHLLLFVGVAANGYVRENTSMMFALNPDRLDAFELAAILTGNRTSRTVHHQGAQAFGTADLTRLSWGMHTRFAPIAAEHRSIEQYTGRVWCPTVHAAGSYLARSNGKVFYTGNSVNHWCSDEATRILTRDHGWITHDLLEPGDVVMTLDHDTGLGEWQPVGDIYRADVVDLEMMSIETRLHSSLTTMNHRWPTIDHINGYRRWRTSETLTDSDQFVRAAPTAGIVGEAKWSDAFVELVAWFATEGTCRYPRKSPASPPQVLIGQSHVANPAKTAQIRRCLTDLFGPAHVGHMGTVRVSGRPTWREQIEDHRGMTLFCLNAAAAAELLIVAPDRVVDRQWVHELTTAQLALFVETFIDGDGSRSANGRATITQTSLERLEAVELAAILLGRATSTQVRPGRGFSTGDQHSLSLHAARPVAGSRNHRESTTYTGTIWCPTTPNRSWLAERNGTVYFTGNTAANIDSEFIVKHVQPIGQLIADFLTTGYLRPMLMAYEDMTEEEAEAWRVDFDPSPVIARADEAKSAMDLQEWLSDEALLSANGFTKADAASAEAVRQRRLWLLVSTQPAQFGKLLPLINGFETIDPEMLNPAPAAPPPGAPPVPPGAAANGATNGAANGAREPATGNQQPPAGAPRAGNEPKPAGQADTGTALSLRRSASPASSREMLGERISTAADAAVRRAVERAASRVISLARSKSPDLHGRIRSVRKRDVMSMCTEHDLVALGTTRAELLEASFSELANDARTWVAAWLEADGRAHRQADEAGAEVANELAGRLAQLVQDNLLTPFVAGANGLRIPDGLVSEVLDQAIFAGA